MGISVDIKEAAQASTAKKRRIYPFEAREVPETDGRLLAVKYSDIYRYGLDLAVRANDVPAEIKKKVDDNFAIYDSWPLGYEPPSAPQEEKPFLNWFVDRGRPIEPSVDDIHAAFDRNHAQEYKRVLQLKWGDLFTLLLIHEKKEVMPYDTKELTGAYPSIITHDNFFDVAAEADAYLTAYRNKLSAEREKHYQAVDAHRWLTKIIYSDVEKYEWQCERIIELKDQMRKYAPQDDITVYIAVEALEKNVICSLTDDSLSFYKRYGIFEHLVSAGTGTATHVYDSSAAVIKAAPKGDQAFLDGVKQRLSQFEDSEDLIDQAVSYGVKWSVKKIPSELCEDYKNGNIRGAIATYDKGTNTLEAIQPPDGVEDFVNPIECDAYFVHELRHAVRHFNDPLVKPLKDAPKTRDSACAKLLHEKMIEADAMTTEVHFIYQSVTNGGTQPVDAQKLTGMGPFDGALFLIAKLDYYTEKYNSTMSPQGAYQQALADVFALALQDQAPYENKGQYRYLIASDGFEQQWRDAIKDLDKEWCERLTTMKSLGGAPYLPRTDKTIRKKITAALLKTIPQPKSNPSVRIQPSRAEGIAP